MRRLALAGLLALAACGAPIGSGLDAPTRGTGPTGPLPAMRSFAAQPAPALPARSNAAIGGDFLDLSFELESGRALPVLSRFEGPIGVTLRGPAPAVMSRDLDLLLARLRAEAGIDIARGARSGAGAGRIVVEVVPRAQLQRAVPGAACFVAPNVDSWGAWRGARRSPATDWTRLTSRSLMGIFIPGDVSPQEMRDCLHEELAQALGPVNDLYRLRDSVFNDDNFHATLTGFDMLILRATYAPELASGMSRQQVAARLPAILSRLNPAGGGGAPVPGASEPAGWLEAIRTATGAGAGRIARIGAAQRAVLIARNAGGSNHRLATSLYVLGRLTVASDPQTSLRAFAEAERLYAGREDTRLQAAHMGVQLAAHALSTGDPAEAIAISQRYLPAARRGQNAVLMASYMGIEAEALALLGRDEEAQALRLDSLGWARYGFGADAEVGRRMGEIAALSPENRL